MLIGSSRLHAVGAEVVVIWSCQQLKLSDLKLLCKTTASFLKVCKMKFFAWRPPPHAPPRVLAGVSILSVVAQPQLWTRILGGLGGVFRVHKVCTTLVARILGGLWGRPRSVDSKIDQVSSASLASLDRKWYSLRSARTLRVLERRYASCQFICLRSVHTLWNDAVES